jgi:enoyl-[acyl-carrier protein] reductase II
MRLRTRACEVLGIDLPIVQGPLGPFPSVELVAAVGRAGALGSIGAAERSAADLEREITLLREKYDGKFAVNHALTRFDNEAFEATLRLKPAVISFALGDPGELVKRAHDAGAVVMHQANTVEQARRVAELGVDIVIAQGSEAGGNAGRVSTFVLVPQVVDAVAPLPVLAAGGVGDGRGLVAALAFGAAGINVGTRFLASEEAAIGDGWKSAIVRARSDEVTPVEFWYDVFPRHPQGYTEVTPRAIRTPFIERWQERSADVPEHAAEIRAELMNAVRERRLHEYVPMAGQVVGMIDDVLPAEQIIRRYMQEAIAALEDLAGYRSTA